MRGSLRSLAYVVTLLLGAFWAGAASAGPTITDAAPPGPFWVEYSVQHPGFCWTPGAEVTVHGLPQDQSVAEGAHGIEGCRPPPLPIRTDDCGSTLNEAAFLGNPCAESQVNRGHRTRDVGVPDHDFDHAAPEQDDPIEEGRGALPATARGTYSDLWTMPTLVLTATPLEDLVPWARQDREGSGEVSASAQVTFRQQSSADLLVLEPPAPAALPAVSATEARGPGPGASSAVAAPETAYQTGAGGVGRIPAQQALVGAAVVAFAAFALYQRFSPSASFDHERRAAIHRALGECPDGATSGDIARLLGMNRKTVDYHLTYLARLDKVRTGMDENGARRYSLRPLPDRQPLVERVLGIVRSRPGMSILELADALGVSRSAADRHAKALIIQGTLESRLVDGERKLFASG